MTASKILIAAGGTGGHLLPAQQLAELLQRRGYEIFFAGYKLAKSPYFQRDRFPFREISSSPLQKNLFGLIVGFFQAVRMLWKEKPAVVVGFGSYHTAPVLLAAALLGKKIVLYEANRVVGKVNRLILPFAKAMAIQFPLIGKIEEKAVAVPLFPWIKAAPESDKRAIQKELGLDLNRKTVLVFGGSQGAAFLNEMIPSVLNDSFQVIHLAGNEKAASEVKRAYEAKGIVALVKGYESNMPLVYRAADFAICRSGAGTSAELIRFELPSILIPYPSAADDHQRHNAEFMTAFGGASWIAQAKTTPSLLQERIENLPLESMRLALREQKAQHVTQIELDALVAKWG